MAEWIVQVIIMFVLFAWVRKKSYNKGFEEGRQEAQKEAEDNHGVEMMFGSQGE